MTLCQISSRILRVRVIVIVRMCVGGGGMEDGERSLISLIVDYSSFVSEEKRLYIYNRYKTLFAYQSINKSSFSMNFTASCVLRTLLYSIYYTESQYF